MSDRAEPRRRRLAVPADPRAFLRADVEVRVTGGGLVRGRLVEVGDRYLLVERHGGRLALVELGAVTLVMNESDITRRRDADPEEGSDP